MKVNLNIKIDMPSANFKDIIKKQEFEDIIFKVLLNDISSTINSYTDEYEIDYKY